jgi:SSS family solute:Na+ symporter
VWGNGASGWWYLAMLGPAFVVSPGILQKVYGARDARTVRIGVGLNALGLFGFAIVPVLMGMIARVMHPGLAKLDTALPLLLATDLPVLLGGLGLAALFSAEVSAADAVLFMLTTSLSQDLYRRFINPAASDERMLVVARMTALGAGALGIGMALVSRTIIDALSIFYTLLGVSLFVPMIAGLYARRAGTPETLAAIGAGVVAVIAAQFGTAGKGIGGWTPAMLGLACAFVAWALVSVIRPAGTTGQIGEVEQ